MTTNITTQATDFNVDGTFEEGNDFNFTIYNDETQDSLEDCFKYFLGSIEYAIKTVDEKEVLDDEGCVIKHSNILVFDATVKVKGKVDFRHITNWLFDLRESRNIGVDSDKSSLFDFTFYFKDSPVHIRITTSDYTRHMGCTSITLETLAQEENLGCNIWEDSITISI